MKHTSSLRQLDKQHLLREFSALVEKDRRDTATMLAYIAEIDRRKLYLEHACPSMFAFCTTRFHMSEAVAARRIRAGRATCRFPCISGMVARGELHLSGIHQLAGHLTEENHKEVLQRAKHRSMREIERLIAEISPKPDVPTSIRALPIRRSQCPPSNSQESLKDEPAGEESLPFGAAHPHLPTSLASDPVSASRPPRSLTTPLSPRRYKLQVTIGQEARDKLAELRDLLSHQIPDGDLAVILDRALDALLAETKKRKAALTDKPRATRKRGTNKGRAIPAHVRREVFERDEGQCVFVDAGGQRCGSGWQVEFHHRIPYARTGGHSAGNIELRCRAHNQYEAELEYGTGFMVARRLNEPDEAARVPP
jgi:5-methylcytosine-specific restriction endonuclease McrA